MIHIPNSIFSVPQCYKLQLQLQNTLKSINFKYLSFSDFFLECFPNLTTGLSDEGRGQVEPSTHKHCLRRREKLVEGM